jgi:hypothetical protein
MQPSDVFPAYKEPFLNQLARVILVHNWYRSTSMCIQVNTRVLPVVTNFERVWHESYWVRTGTVSLVCVVTWKTWFHGKHVLIHLYTKFVHRIQWIHVRKHVNWASWTREFTYRTCEIMLGWLDLTRSEECWPDSIVNYKAVNYRW